MWNHGPDLIDADGAVVVCEALLDAASVWIAGRRSVTAAYGVHGWTDDHDTALGVSGGCAAGRARSVFIAFDADAAGDAGAAAMAEKLISRGLSVFRVHWPAGLKDANAVLTAADLGGPAIIEALRTATWLGGAPRVIVPALPPAFIDAVQSGEEESGDGDAISAELSAADPASVDPVAALPGAAADAVSPEHAAPFSSSLLTGGLPHAVTPAPAPVPTPASTLPPGVQVHDAGPSGDVAVVIGTRRYRVRGLERNRGYDVLKINLRVAVLVAGPGAAASVAPAERFHVDTLDLYQTRLRHAFVAAATVETGLHADLVKADLGTLLLTLEAVQHQRTAAAAASGNTAATGAAAESTAPVMTADEEAAARALLCAPDVLDQIAADLGRCGLVGEERNTRAAMLACVSRLTDQPLAVLVQSTSAAGKTTLMDAVLSFLPESAVRRYSAMSGKSAFYLGSTPIKHRVLAIAEEEGARRASYALKLLQSDGKLTMAATGKDPESGRLVTHDYTVEGPVMLFLTTTAIDLDPELVNRCLVLAVDESPEQTAAIHAAQRTARTLAGLTASAERAAIRRRHQHAQALLRSYPVILPPDTRFHFAATSSRLRRDHQKFLNLISAVTLLHQFQRTHHTLTGPDGATITYLEATPADISLAADVAATVLPRTLDDLPPQTRRLWDAVRALVGERASAQGCAAERVDVTRRELRDALGWSYDQIRAHLGRLLAQEYLVAQATRPGDVGRYRIVAGIDDDRPGSPVGGHTHTPTVGTVGGSGDPLGGVGSPGSNDGEKAESEAIPGPLGGFDDFTQGATAHAAPSYTYRHPVPAPGPAASSAASAPAPAPQVAAMRAE